MNLNIKTARRLVVIFMVASLVCAVADMVSNPTTFVTISY